MTDAPNEQHEASIDLDRAEVRISLRCVECGYDVRGLKAGGKCPECGHPVLDTVQRAACVAENIKQPGVFRMVGRRLAFVAMCGMAAALCHLLFESAPVFGWDPWTIFRGCVSLRVLPGVMSIVAAFAAMDIRLYLRDQHIRVNAGALSPGLLMVGVCDLAMGMIIDPDSPVTDLASPIILLVLELGVVTGAVLSVLAGIALLSSLSNVSHTPRASRQGARSMVVAGIVAASGHVCIFIGPEFAGRDPWLAQIGFILVVLATLMFTIGLGYLTVNAWLVRKALTQPPLTLGRILRIVE